MMSHHENRNISPTTRRTGFTLIELLVVVAILVIMTGVVVGTWRMTASNDRTGAAARQLQSVILGARDRAIYAIRDSASASTRARGVRFIQDTSVGAPTNAISSLVYVQASDPVRYGSYFPDTDVLKVPGSYIRIVRHSDGQKKRIYLYPGIPNGGPPYLTAPDPNPLGPPDNKPPEVYIPGQVSNRTTSITALPSQGFLALYQSGLLSDEARIRVWINSYQDDFTVSTEFLTGQNNGNNPSNIIDGSLLLTSEIAAAGEWNGNDGTTAQTPRTIAYEDGSGMSIGIEIEQSPIPVPGMEPINLPQGTVMSLPWSYNLPPNWSDSQVVQKDLMFAPRGSVTDRLSAFGLIHFGVWNRADLEGNDVPPTGGAPISQVEPMLTRLRTALVVTVVTQTGQVITTPYNTVPLVPANGLLFDDLFYSAKSGEVISK